MSSACFRKVSSISDASKVRSSYPELIVMSLPGRLPKFPTDLMSRLSATQRKMMQPSVSAYMIEVSLFVYLWAIRFFFSNLRIDLRSQKKSR